MSEEKKEIVKSESVALSERFMEKILSELRSSISDAPEITEFQRQLIRGYYFAIDRALATAEEERLRKNAANTDPKFNNDLPVSWKNINLADLAIDLAHYSRVGLDMRQENMLFPIPYKNNKKGYYDVTLMEGYNGIRYIAEKYALYVPKATTVEVIYSTDVFKPIKKSATNPVEGYEFEITSPFDRGEIKGAFAYLEFDEPTQNILIIMTMKDIMKRKPRYAAPEFWGGKKKVKKNGTWVEEEMEGWLDEMVRKTIIREAYSAKYLPRDPRKIDDSYQYLKTCETKYAVIEAEAEIAENANSVPIDVTRDEKPEDKQEEQKPVEEPKAVEDSVEEAVGF
jgi:recombination protein RecT